MLDANALLHNTAAEMWVEADDLIDQSALRLRRSFFGREVEIIGGRQNLRGFKGFVERVNHKPASTRGFTVSVVATDKHHATNPPNTRNFPSYRVIADPEHVRIIG